MSEPSPNAELMRSLGRLVRGLSALFWGLPLTLLVCYYTTRADSLRALRGIPAFLGTGLLVYGLWQMSGFQKQERIWRKALDRAGLLAVTNFILSPFLYWWGKAPTNEFFTVMVVLMAVSGLVFLMSVNRVLERLGAMLPDETLRLETKQFTAFNCNLLILILGLTLAYVAADFIATAHPEWLPEWLLERLLRAEVYDYFASLALLLLVLLPLAMTMALLWKTKEVILEGVFGGDHTAP